MAVGGVWLGGEEDYTQFNLSTILPHVRRLLEYDLMRIVVTARSDYMASLLRM